MGITTKRVRQLEITALEKIRNKSSEIDSFSIYMENSKQAIENIEEYRQKYKYNKSYNKKR